MIGNCETQKLSVLYTQQYNYEAEVKRMEYWSQGISTWCVYNSKSFIVSQLPNNSMRMKGRKNSYLVNAVESKN